MAIAQRIITVSRNHIPTNRKPQKAIPTAIQTSGDYILVKRFEKGLTKRQVAQTLEVTSLTVKQWEQGGKMPTQAQWLKLKDLLNLSDWLRNQ